VLLGLGDDDELAAADRLVADSELEETVEHEPAAAGAAPVEAEDEFVQVRLQVRVVDRTLVCAEQPASGERGHPVHAGQQHVGVVTAQARGALAVPLTRAAEAPMPA